MGRGPRARARILAAKSENPAQAFFKRAEWRAGNTRVACSPSRYNRCRSPNPRLHECRVRAPRVRRPRHSDSATFSVRRSAPRCLPIRYQQQTSPRNPAAIGYRFAVTLRRSEPDSNWWFRVSGAKTAISSNLLSLRGATTQGGSSGCYETRLKAVRGEEPEVRIQSAPPRSPHKLDTNRYRPKTSIEPDGRVDHARADAINADSVGAELEGSRARQG